MGDSSTDPPAFFVRRISRMPEDYKTTKVAVAPSSLNVRRRPRLRTQLLVGFVAVAAAPLLVFVAIAGGRLSNAADREAARSLSIEAETVAERIDDYIDGHRRGIAFAAASARGSRPGRTDYQPSLRQLGIAFNGFLTLLVADSTGQIVAAHAPRTPETATTATRRSVADRPYFRSAMSTNRPFLSDAFRGRGLGTDAIVAVAAPIQRDDGTPVGIIEGSLDLSRFERFARGSRDRASGRLVIVDRGGRVVYSSGETGLQLLQSITDTPLGIALRSALPNDPVVYNDGRAAGELLAVVSVSMQTGWRVIVAQQHSVAQQAGRTYLWTIITGIVLSALLSVLLALRMGGLISRPIDDLIARLRHFDARAPIPAQIPLRKDVPAEVASLIDEFSGMSQRVHEYSVAQHASESRFRAIFDHAAIGIAVHDADGRFVDANPAFQQVVGFTRSELIGRRASELSPPEEADVTRLPVRALQAGEVDSVHVEKRFRHSDGRLLTCELTVSRLEDAAFGQKAGIVGMVQDVTERRKLERDMAWRANHDVLTGLANRAQLNERLAAALDRKRVTRSVAVMVLDLDEFKRINDSLGHGAGDQLLCEVSRRLLSATRGCDVVARLGGDEFAMVLDGVDSAVNAEIAAKRILASFARPVSLESAEVVISTSIGIAYADADETAECLLRNADTAMYRAKHSGKGRFDTFTSAMHEEVINLLSMENDMRVAVDNEEFSAAFQLIVDLRTGTPVGAECLIRWARGERGPVSPARFIPVAEQTGLIVPMGRWILREACRQGATWLARLPRQNGAPPFTVTVNVSGRQLQHPEMVSEVRDALRDSGFDPRCLVLEITESVVMNNPETAIRRLSDLKALGIRLAIDDFGTGYSSLSYLQRLPIDILKIDKSFVDGIGETSRDAALVRTILGMAETLSLRCVAEGIEREDQYRVLKSLGCQYGQGYLFAKPMAAEEAGALLCENVLRNAAA